MFYALDLHLGSELILKVELNHWNTKWNKVETNVPHTVI